LLRRRPTSLCTTSVTARVEGFPTSYRSTAARSAGKPLMKGTSVRITIKLSYAGGYSRTGGGVSQRGSWKRCTSHVSCWHTTLASTSEVDPRQPEGAAEHAERAARATRHRHLSPHGEIGALHVVRP